MSELEAEYRQAAAQGGWVDLSSRTQLQFSGPDRVRYLNGQFTANLLAAKAPAVLPACVATAKGKLCAAVFVTVMAGALLVDAEAELADSLAARLEKYLVADDVQFSVLTGTLPQFHVFGAAAAAVPPEMRANFVPVNRLGIPGFDAVPPDAATRDWLRAHRPECSPALLEVIRIERGVPRWGAELDENTFPSEAGLDRTHVDYHKGCYIGQEVISRLRSVGQANRGLRGFTAGAPLAAGMRLFSAGDPARDLGRLTSATHSFALDRPVALGYLRRGAPEIGLLAAHADAPGAPVPVHLHPLPFVS